MDPISRENSPSYLPVAGLIAGLLGLLLGVIALVNASKASSRAAAYTDEKVAAQTARIDGIESTVSTAAATADRTAGNIASLQRSTQDAFTAVAGEISKINTELAKAQEAAKAAPKAAGKAGSAPAVAGPDEYIVAGGDTGMKIARAKGVSLADLQAVNPGINWGGLKVGQKLKLPKK